MLDFVCRRLQSARKGTEMRTQIERQVAAALTLIIGVAAPASGQPLYRSYPPETVKTELRYDSASRNLRVRCAAASGGICRIFVKDAGVERMVSLRPSKSATFKRVTSGAQQCTLGKNPAMCTWQRVSP